MRLITQIALDGSLCICVQYMKCGGGGRLGRANTPSLRYSLQAGKTRLASTSLNNSYHTGLITYTSNTHWSQEHRHYPLDTHPCAHQGARVSSPGSNSWRRSGLEREKGRGERVTSTSVNEGAAANFPLIHNR